MELCKPSFDAESLDCETSFDLHLLSSWQRFGTFLYRTLVYGGRLHCQWVRGPLPGWSASFKLIIFIVLRNQPCCILL